VARHRLCMTGTPLENHPLELWSLFHFLMPGLLGTERGFRNEFMAASDVIEPANLERLHRRTTPFILRRLKQEVAPDLPPRSEMVAYCELGPDQRKLYNQTLSLVRSGVFETIEREGLGRSHLHILEALLRLRQICCAPELVLPENGPVIASAKVDTFMELVQQVVAEGHRILVFSQFVKVLHILRRHLERENIPTEYLDGQTKDRLERAERFNTGDVPVFLISLKAGGTGLNLTGADYVIHFDPWWNPAVEDQATDRAHRIGQTRHVFSYKLIAKDTIEEKVVQLQERKRKMVQGVLQGEEFGRKLTRDDLDFLFSLS
ncbi:MAG: DEAD/DEAH box helicase, partial [Cyanobacteria bacterium REEB65]|nr:DEAD/DEAH box helicase [Cyanobacteria bacterium REEB65]